MPRGTVPRRQPDHSASSEVGECRDQLHSGFDQLHEPPYNSDMEDDLFPSGPWTGFYNYTGPEDRHRMDLRLEFKQGRMTGAGSDNVGYFLIDGSYDPVSKECHWTKSYPGSHHVCYRGFREGVGIWGTWEIPPSARGGFHIWPRRFKQGESEELETTLEVPASTSVPSKTRTQ